jgi:hypothetical protein
MIARVCFKYCPHGSGVDSCSGSDKARTPDFCQWHAELAHPLDEPDGLQDLATRDTPDRFSGV